MENLSLFLTAKCLPKMISANNLTLCLGPVPEGLPEDLFDSRIRCYHCGLERMPPESVSGFSLLCEVNGVHTFSKRTFSLYRCETCGMGVTFPRIAERYIPILYENHATIPFSEEEGIVDNVRKLFFLLEARWWLKRIGTIGNFSGDGVQFRILDFGTGSGMNAIAFARVLKDRGRVWATDFATQTPPRLLESTQVSYIPYELLEKSDQKFDCIHVRNTLEHASNPLLLLSRLRESLSTGGSLLIEVPSLFPALHPFTMRHFQELFQSNLPYHYYFFTPESMRVLLLRAGFSSEIRTMDIPVIGRMLQARTGSLFKGRRYLLLFAIGILLYPLQWLYVRLVGSYPVIRALARKIDDMEITSPLQQIHRKNGSAI